jgi:hypothetical protein
MGEVFVRRDLSKAVLQAYAEQIDDRGARGNDTPIVLTVTAKLGDLRALRETLVRIDYSSERTKAGAK